MQWMILSYKRYADFNGRLRRMEFWMFTLFYYIVLVLLLILTFAGLPWGELRDPSQMGPTTGPNALIWIGMVLLVVFMLGSIIPMIAVTVRRFHDQDKSGWLYLLNFIPYVGPIVVLVFMFIEGTKGPNLYGEDPKDPHTAGIFA